MTNAPLWYAGCCAKRQEHDPVVMIEVVSRHEVSGWMPLENVQKLFPKTGEVELRAPDGKSLRSNDWVAFTLNPKTSKHWTANTYRNLPRYADLSHLGSLDEVRRELVVKGLQTAEPGGAWIVRASRDRVVKVELRRVGDGVFLSPANAKVCVYAFDDAALIQMRRAVSHTALYDAGPGPSAIAILDWTPDVNYACRVVRALGLATDSRIETAIASLEKHAQEASARLGAHDTDLAAAYEALRSGELAKRLREDRQQLQAYMHALQADPKIAALVKSEIVAIAEKERGRIQATLTKQLEHELQSERRARIAVLDTEIGELSETKRAELDQNHAARMQESQAKLEAQNKEVEAKLARKFSENKEHFEKTIAELDKERNHLQNRVDALAEGETKLTARIEVLRQDEHQAEERLRRVTEDLDRLLAAGKAAAATRPNGISGLGAVVPWRCPERGTSIFMGKLRVAITACPLLSEPGKQLMEQFIGLALAGDVPALVGEKVDDFLWVAESLISNGTSARLEADPLMIAYDDLWVRAGMGVPTPIAQALELAQGEDPTTSLAVIERAERSGARFWYPALVDRARRGDLPRRLLLCVTVEDEECEEARAILRNAVRLDADQALVAPATTIAINMVGIVSHGELDPGKRPVSMPRAVQVVLSGAAGLSIKQALRVARVAAELSNLVPDADVTAMTESLLRLFAPLAASPKTTTNAL
jgi:hypothetical protein